MTQFYNGLAEIFEVPEAEIAPNFSLVEHNWDSLAIISTVVLIDECYGLVVDGASLGKCEQVGDLDQLVSSRMAMA